MTWTRSHPEANLQGLAQLLQLQINARIPDGRNALVRFWDLRVLTGLVDVLNPRQREIFFS